MTKLCPPACPSPHSVCGGVLRGPGRQAFRAKVGAIMYYVTGLPLGIVLAFVVRMRIMGMCNEEKSGEAWAVIGHSPTSPVSYRPLAGPAGLGPAGSGGLCGLHCPEEWS